MRRLLYTAVMIWCISSVLACVNTKNVEAELDKADAFISTQPQLTLEILDSINKEDLVSPKIKARHALLYSIALDRNYVDLKKDSTISPAVTYYKNHGSADEKLKTYYYWGRIAMNNGEYENAISRFVAAEQYADEVSDKRAVGRLYKAQTSVYQYCYDTDAMIEAAKKTTAVYMALGDTTKFIVTLFDQTAGYLNQVDTTNARNVLELIKEYWNKMTESQKSQYFANQLILCGHTYPSALPELLKVYEREIKEQSLVRWLPVAKAYYLCQDYTRAIEAIDNYNYYGGLQNDAYFWIAGLIYDAVGNSSMAMHCYKNYIEQTDDKLGYLLEADIRFVKERYENQIKMTRNKYGLTVLALSVVILSLLSILVVNRVKRIKRENFITEENLKIKLRTIEAEIDKYTTMYNAALAEIDNLNDALKNNTLEINVRSLVSQRLNLLNKFIAANMTPNFSVDASKELKQLMQDKHYFIESTRTSFLIEHPKFIGLLKKKKLSDSEIGYCCLYAMGLKGKDISAYMGNGHYKLSSLIRKKLGLSEHDTNLDIYLREILAKTAS